MPDENPVDPRFLGPSAEASVPRLYANAIAIRGGPFDVTLDLGFSTPPASPDQAPEPPDWLARVTMSWEHANALKRFLESTIRSYEDQVGQLPDVEKVRVGGQQ